MDVSIFICLRIHSVLWNKPQHRQWRHVDGWRSYMDALQCRIQRILDAKHGMETPHRNKYGQIVTAEEAVENENINITSTISIIIKSSISGSFFSCKIYFSTKKHTRQANVANTPNFSFVCKLPEITNTGPLYRDTNLASLTTVPLDKIHNSTTNVCKCCWIIIFQLNFLSGNHKLSCY